LPRAFLAAVCAGVVAQRARLFHREFCFVLFACFCVMRGLVRFDGVAVRGALVGVEFKAAYEFAQVRGHLRLAFRRFLRIRGSVRGALRRLCHALNILRHFARALGSKCP
jgi:hypothetical protein